VLGEADGGEGQAPESNRPPVDPWRV